MYDNAQMTTGRSVKPKGSSKGSSEKESLAFLQNEWREKWKLNLLEERQKLEKIQAEGEYLWAKEIPKLTQRSDVSVSNEVLTSLEARSNKKHQWQIC